MPQGLAGQLRGFDLDEYLGETEGDGIPIPWGVGNDAVPESRGGNPSSGTRADVAKHDPSGGSPVSDSHAGIIERVMNSSSGIREKIVVLFIADYQKHSENAQCVAKLHAAFSKSMPGWKVTVHTVYGAFEDDHGLWSHVDGATGKLKGERQVKRARVDLLTSCAKVLRAMGSYLPDFAVGIGQGGVIAGMLRYPLLVEVTLQARNLQRKEVHEAVAGWAGLRALWSVNPRLWRSQSGAALLQAACPEVGRDFPVEPVRGFGVVSRVPKEEEIRQIAEVLKVGMVKDVTDVHLTSLAREPKREVWEHDGKCSCGKRSYVFARCVTCIEKEAADDLRAATELREKQDREDAEMAEEDALLVLGAPKTSATSPGTRFVQGSLVLSWAKSWASNGGQKGFSVLPRGLGRVAGWMWTKGQAFKVPELDDPELPYCITWGVNLDYSVFQVHYCCQASKADKAAVAWELERVNWKNHHHLVKTACEKAWQMKGGEIRRPKEMEHLVVLLGQVTGTVAWDDGVAADAIGFRRDLHSKKVLVAFARSNPEGFWGPVEIGKKIQVKEGQSRPTVAILGESWPFRVVVHLRTSWWVLTQWSRSSGSRVFVLSDKEGAEKKEKDQIPDRRELAAEVRLSAGVNEFSVTGSLHSAWYEGQRKDSSLAGHFRRPGEPFRVAGDGLLERSVVLQTGEKVWAAVIPGGFAAPNGLTWRRACFNQAHHGALGGHRSADRTFQILSRSVWWAGMKEDVQRWTLKCLVCLKARGRPRKVTAGASRCLADACWQEVSVDCEGPSREDRWGYRYSLTYLDCLSHAVLLEPMRSLTHAEVRRAFGKCLFRSRTLPTLVRSDRGTEFRNSMMAEFFSLLGIQQRFSMAMRPCEMGSNERVHQEVQKALHIIIRELAHDETDEWSELLPVVEYLLDNTPGPHGYTPRDLERSWSLGLELEKDLLKESMQFEPVSEWARSQFDQFSKLSKKVAQHWDTASAARAQLANRYRRNVEFSVGDRVVWQSPKARPEGAGRVPWKRGLSGPWVVVEVRGARLFLRAADDASARPFEAHAEDCILVPEDLEDPLPRPELALEEPEAGEAPSLGQRIQGEAEQREFTLQRRGRQFVLRIGEVIAYSKGAKVCYFGRVTQVSVEDGTVGVHRYKPVVSSLRVKWALAYLNETGEVAENGTRPWIEQIRLKEVATKVDISREGVLGAASSRKLDKSGYRLFEEEGVAVLAAAKERAEVDKVLQFVGALDQRQGAGQGAVRPEDPLEDLLLLWLERHKVEKADFLELCAGLAGRSAAAPPAGFAGLSTAARSAGYQASPVINDQRGSYGRLWNLSQRGDQELVLRLVQWLDPLLVHVRIEGRATTDVEFIRFVVAFMTQRKKDGRLVTVACPSDSKVCQLPSVVEVIGTAEVPLFPWSVVRTDDCQFGPATSGAGWFWISNLDLSAISLPCKKPDALVSPVHSHLPKQQGPGGEGHPQACCEAYWACVGPQLPFRTPVTESVGLPQRAKDGGSGLRFRDQIASVALEKEKAGENIEVPKSDVDVSRELTAAEREALDKELEELSARMDKLWKERADSGNWEEVKADLGVYRLSGEVVTVDPRRAESYRQQVVEGLGFGSEAAVRHPDLTADDVAACREVLSRKAAGFWLEGTPRTTVRNVAHDCVPTGPPVSLQPHALKGESAAWVDERLEEEVARGQLVRGSSAWGSPPFPTKEAPAHKKMRKRRLVVDYRRVNARVLRSTYYCRKASDVLAQCAGSVWYSFVDAVTGFNQIANTRRAMEVLAIVARSGKFLPVCLTFGPVNGPDDFCYVVDRAFGPGRGRRARFAREWVAYIDDLTVRTGRAIDGQYLTDAEYEEEVKRAMREGPVEVPQVTGEALEALGIKPKSLGAEKAEKKKHDERVSDHNHPTRSKGSFRLWARDSKFLSRSRTRTTTLLTVWVLGEVVYLGPPTELHRPPASSSPLCCVSTLVSPQPFGFLGAQCLGREQAEGRALKACKKFDRRGSRLCKPRGLAGLRCVSPAGRGPMGKKGGHRRDPRSNWDDLEYMLTRGLRHGDYMGSEATCRTRVVYRSASPLTNSVSQSKISSRWCPGSMGSSASLPTRTTQVGSGSGRSRVTRRTQGCPRLRFRPVRKRTTFEMTKS